MAVGAVTPHACREAARVGGSGRSPKRVGGGMSAALVEAAAQRVATGARGHRLLLPVKGDWRDMEATLAVKTKVSVRSMSTEA